MEKIAVFIRKQNLKSSDCIYHTWRDVADRNGKLTGKIRVLVPKKGDLAGIAMVEYICPRCSYYGYMEKQWKRPFSIKCEKCNFTIRVPKLKDQAKREAKKG